MVKSGSGLLDKTLKTKIGNRNNTRRKGYRMQLLGNRKNRTRTGYEAVVGASYSGERATHMPLI